MSIILPLQLLIPFCSMVSMPPRSHQAAGIQASMCLLHVRCGTMCSAAAPHLLATSFSLLRSSCCLDRRASCSVMTPAGDVDTSKHLCWQGHMHDHSKQHVSNYEACCWASVSAHRHLLLLLQCCLHPCELTLGASALLYTGGLMCHMLTAQYAKAA